MAWALAATAAALVVVVVALIVAAVMLAALRGRLASVEVRLAAQTAPQAARHDPPEPAEDTSVEYLITRIGEPDPVPLASSSTQIEPAAFADQLARESTVQLAALAHGLRRALSPETRNRIRFHMRQEVKRSRRRRRVEMRVAHREWTARQRADAAAGEPAAS